MSILFEPFDDPIETIGGSGFARIALRARGFGEALAAGEGRGAVELRLRSLGYGEAPEVDPEEPTFGFGQSTIVLVAAGSGPGTFGGEGAAVIDLQARGWEGANHGAATLRLATRGADVSANDIPNQVSLIAGTFFGAGLSYRETKILRARAALAAPLAATWEGTRTLRSTVDLDVAMYLVYRELLASSVEIGAEVDVDYLAIAHMADALLLGAAVTSLREAHALITESLTLQALASGFDYLNLADEVAFGAALERYYTGYAAMVDEALIGVTMTGHLTLVASMADTVAFDVSTVATFEGFATLRDQVDLVARMLIDDELHVAWSVLGQTKAATRYTNYPFNSFLRLPAGSGWRYYGLTDTGLYRLDGADDDGEAINAHLRLGLTDLGSRVLKRIASAYLGYTADGDLRLKVVVANSETGAREAHTYRLYASGAASEREGRVKVGRGLKSVYMDFVVENIDGANFEIDCIEILPLWLERRIRGNAGGKS